MLDKFDIFYDNTNNCYQVRTKTNTFSIVFDEKEQENIFFAVVQHFIKNPELTLQQLKSLLIKNFKEEKVLQLLTDLAKSDLLSFEMQAELGVNSNPYVNIDPSEIIFISNTSLAIIGSSKVSTEIEIVAKREKFKSVKIYEFENNETLEKFEKIFKEHDFIVVDAQKWSPFHLKMINETALKLNKPWLYIGGISEFSIEIGPLFYGRETGCYNCLMSRLKSNQMKPQFFVEYEKHLTETKKPGAEDLLPHEGVLYKMISCFVVYDIMKFIESWALPVTWQTIIKFNVFNYTSTMHSLLKKPYCETCRPVLKYNPSPWLDKITLK